MVEAKKTQAQLNDTIERIMQVPVGKLTTGQIDTLIAAMKEHADNAIAQSNEIMEKAREKLRRC